MGAMAPSLHMEIMGIMDPFDIHDPDQNPLAGKTEAERWLGRRWAAATRAITTCMGASGER